ncbi:UDP-glucosyltransferase 2-like [Spodoptera frugiperda]|uniref:UDP-glucuronosyltransferase n=1 Tax=Spodoptera frugiperda TaxID=7108 RepID=A0A9R0DIC9_SPOFR|nr:UDP-glucosyltransferase 2-like [Spodoptera frugiperda]
MLLCYIISVLISVNEAARILAVFPTPSISHQIVFRPLTQELARRGHDVTIITPDPAFPKGETPANITEIDVHEISYKLWHDRLLTSMGKGEQDDLKSQIEIYYATILEIVLQQLQNDEVQKVISDKHKKFDLLFLEACVRPALLYSHIYKAPVIQISSFGAMPGNLEAVGAPDHPILYPNIFRQKTNNITMREKFVEIFKYYAFNMIHKGFEVTETAAIRKVIGPDMPEVGELFKNVHMLFLNVHPVFEGIRPVPPNVIYMGGLHQNPVKELPQDLKSYLDNSKNGVIYVSFGTNVITDQLPIQVKDMIKVLSRLPYDVLLKWDDNELPGRPTNIRVSKWLPQSDLLRHPNVKLFIMQGGLQSTDEAITAGVPLIGLPMLADQWFNVERYEYHGIGIRIDWDTFTEEKFENAVTKIIGSESYRQNVIKLQTLIHDQPMRPLERAVWWTEHVLRHGGARHLRGPAANMSWAEYHELDLVLFLITSLLILVFIFIALIYYVCRYCVTLKKLKAD